MEECLKNLSGFLRATQPYASPRTIYTWPHNASHTCSRCAQHNHGYRQKKPCKAGWHVQGELGVWCRYRCAANGLPQARRYRIYRLSGPRKPMRLCEAGILHLLPPGWRLCPPISKATPASTLQTQIVPSIGYAVPLCRAPTSALTTLAKPNCSTPTSDEAAPA